MKILVVIPYYKPAYYYGGPIASVSALNEALVKQGHTVTVLTTNANGPQNLGRNLPGMLDGVEVLYFNRWLKDQLNFSPKLLWYFFRNIKKYDVIHLHFWWNLVTIPAVLLCWLLRIRPVLSSRGSVSPYAFTHRKAGIKQLFHSLIGRSLLNFCHVHITSLQEHEDVMRLIPNAKIDIIPNALKLPDKPFLHVSDPKFLKLIYLGRLDAKKNIEFLFYVLLNQDVFPFTLHIVGGGTETYVEQLKEMTRDRKEIIWQGPVYGSQKYQHLAQADLLLLPSKNENFANVVIEALSQGTAVCVSNNVGVKEYVLENELGWVAPLDTNVWTGILTDVWWNRESLVNIRNTAPSIVRRDFGQSVVAEKYASMYRHIINSGGSGRPSPKI